jgi:hypothetical protein
VPEDYLNLLQLKIRGIQGGEFRGAVWGSGRESGHVRRQPFLWRERCKEASKTSLSLAGLYTSKSYRPARWRCLR